MPTFEAQLQTARMFAEMARAANHPFPEMAAAEACLESCFGKSHLAVDGHNLFGVKQHAHPIYDTIVIPTREFIDGQWVIDGNTAWVKYPSFKESFEDRVATLKRLAPKYPHYKAALEAKNPIAFITEVSKTWSTDPQRGDKCIHFFKSYFPALYAEATAQPEVTEETPAA
ncbi:MAG TPA: glucosaminidase domain-containing protein [Terriglobales bacterium]|nr:glucosaminidase domain-containing protein [Terriglobales bacterium]